MSIRDRTITVNSEQDLDLGRMHGDRSRAGMNPGSMHRNMAPAGDQAEGCRS
jgi:hypothetical protein